MKFFIWRNEPAWIAVAHAESVAQARKMLLGEVGGIDGSCVVRAKARAVISEDAPEIWTGPNAEFALTDSAELEEQGAATTALRAALAAPSPEPNDVRREAAADAIKAAATDLDMACSLHGSDPGFTVEIYTTHGTMKARESVSDWLHNRAAELRKGEK